MPKLGLRLGCAIYLMMSFTGIKMFEGIEISTKYSKIGFSILSPQPPANIERFMFVFIHNQTWYPGFPFKCKICFSGPH